MCFENLALKLVFLLLVTQLERFFLCQLKMPFSASPDYYILGRKFSSLRKWFSLFKSAQGRVSLVNSQYEYVWMSAACRGSPSVVCRMMGTGRLAALRSFLCSLLEDRRKAHLNSLLISLLITDKEGHHLLSGAVQAPRKFLIRPPT